MKILVTGCAGYISSVTSEMLIAEGHDVVGVDNFLFGHEDSISEGVEFYRLDLNNAMALSEVFEKHSPEAVIHFAGRTLVGESEVVCMIVAA